MQKLYLLFAIVGFAFLCGVSGPLPLFLYYRERA